MDDWAWLPEIVLAILALILAFGREGRRGSLVMAYVLVALTGYEVGLALAGTTSLDPLATLARGAVLLGTAIALALPSPTGRAPGVLGALGAFFAVSVPDAGPMLLGWCLIVAASYYQARPARGIRLIGGAGVAAGLLVLSGLARTTNLAEMAPRFAQLASPLSAGPLLGLALILGGLALFLAFALPEGPRPELPSPLWASFNLPLVTVVVLARILLGPLEAWHALWIPGLAMWAIAGQVIGLRLLHRGRSVAGGGRGAWWIVVGTSLLGLVAAAHPEARHEGVAAALGGAIALLPGWVLAATGGGRLARGGRIAVWAALPGAGACWFRLGAWRALIVQGCAAVAGWPLALAALSALLGALAAYTFLREDSPPGEEAAGATLLALRAAALFASFALFVFPDPLWQLAFKAAARL